MPWAQRGTVPGSARKLAIGWGWRQTWGAQSAVLTPDPGGGVLQVSLPSGLCPGAKSLTKVWVGTEGPPSHLASPPSPGGCASAASLLHPSSSLSSPPSWWAATFRHWCAGAGRAGSSTRCVCPALGPRGGTGRCEQGKSVRRKWAPQGQEGEREGGRMDVAQERQKTTNG